MVDGDRWVLLALCGALGACSSESDGAPAGAPACAELWVDGVTEPDADGPDTQIHGTSAFDGSRIWMAWNRPDANNGFDVWLAAYGCDGQRAVEPLEATASDDNEIDPVLSVSGDRLIVAWTSDNGTGVDNLDIRYRVFDLEGNPQGEVIELAASRGGVPVTGNALGPSVAPTASGWILAGAWGHADAPAFQAFGVELGFDGAVLGDAMDGELNSSVGQTAVKLARDGDLTYIAWQEDSTTSSAPSVALTTLGTVPQTRVQPGARPSVAAGPIYAWDGNGQDIYVRRGVDNPLALGLGGLVHDASLAVANGSAAIAWMRVTSGLNNEIHAAKLGADGSVLGDNTLPTQSAPSVYPIDLTLVDETRAVIVYQEGASPAFRLKAAWLTL